MQPEEKELKEVRPSELQKDKVILGNTSHHDINRDNSLDEEKSQSSNHDTDTSYNDPKNMTVSIHDPVTESCHDDSEVPLPRRKSSVWVMVKKKMSIADKEATPINWKMILLVFLSLFGSSFSLTFLLPFLPEMVLWFGYKEEDKGYYAGFIASAVFAGRTMGSYFWGWLSDKFGRRPIILITVFLNGFFSLSFGFTFNFPMAVVTRFLTGLANGTVGTAKTIIYEISDNTNQAVGMSFLSMSWGAGLILGPTFGGLLANPVKRYPAVFGGSELLTEFPYLLPGLLVFIVCTMVTVVEFFCLPETLHSKRENLELTVEDMSENDQEEVKVLVGDDEDKKSIKSFTSQQKPKISMSVDNLHLENEAAYYQVQLDVCSQESINRIDKNHCNKESNDDEERSRLLKNSGLKNRTKTSEERQRSHSESVNGTGYFKSNGSVNGSIHTCSKNSLTYKNSCNDCEFTEFTVEEVIVTKKENVFMRCCKSVQQISLIRLLSQSDVRHPVILYMIFSFAVIGYEEIFTIWASTDPYLDGLGFDPGEIGAVLGVTAIPLLLLNAYVFPWCAKRFGIKNTFLGSACLMMILLAIQPIPHLLHDKKPELWTCLLLIILPLKIATSCCFTATALFVNNSVTPSQAGAVNGIAMTSTAIGRTLAPTVGGSIFAWSVSYGSKHLGPPFDVNLSFFVMSLCTLTTIIHAVTLPERLTRQKK